MSAPLNGPTAVEVARARLKAIDYEIKELTAEREMLKHRIKRYQGSTVQEAERVATAAEPFQAKPLPPWPDGVR